MWNNVQLLIVVGVALLAKPFVTAKKYNITVGYLPCVKGEYRNRQGLLISGAISMALEDINNSTDLLPDVKLLLQWNDTKCDPEIATKSISNMRNSGVVAFFGPEMHCQTEGIAAQSRNLPMISYKCSDYPNSTLSNFASLDPPKLQAISAVLSLLRYYRWNKFSILYEEPWKTAAFTLEKYAKKYNMTVNHKRAVLDQFTCCEEKMACCDGKYFYKLIKETKQRTRIYVFLGSTSSLIEIMSDMESLQMFQEGQYMVIFVDMMASSPKSSFKYLFRTEDLGMHVRCPNTPAFKKRARSLLVVASSKPESSYENFMSRVREYNAQEPFKWPQFSIAFRTFVSIYAAYLYDSVKLYATALHSLIEEDTKQKNVTLTYVRLMNVATNGSRIVSRMITNTPFKSVSGLSIRLDKQAKSEGNFSVLAFKPVDFALDDINCTYSMIPVGHFQPSMKELNVWDLAYQSVLS